VQHGRQRGGEGRVRRLGSACAPITASEDQNAQDEETDEEVRVIQVFIDQS